MDKLFELNNRAISMILSMNGCRWDPPIIEELWDVWICESTL